MTPKQAHSAVKQAIKNGALHKQPCQRCGNTNTVAHHDDYNKPLDVQWLCAKHHRAQHKQLQWGEGGRPRLDPTGQPSKMLTVRLTATQAQTVKQLGKSAWLPWRLDQLRYELDRGNVVESPPETTTPPIGRR